MVGNQVYEKNKKRCRKYTVYSLKFSSRNTVSVKFKNGSFHFKAPRAGMYAVKIINLEGVLMDQVNLPCDLGENIFDINTTFYSQGFYYLIIQGHLSEIIDQINFDKSWRLIISGSYVELGVMQLEQTAEKTVGLPKW